MEKKLVIQIKRYFESRYLMTFFIVLLIIRCLTLGIFLNLFANNFFAAILKSELIELINQERKALGLTPLKENEKLDEASRLKAENMISYQYFDHISPSGITPWDWLKRVGYQYKYAGENLAVGFYDSKDVLRAWLNSWSHRENLLNPNYKEVGIAVVKGFGENNATLVVQFLADGDHSKSSFAVQTSIKGNLKEEETKRIGTESEIPSSQSSTQEPVSSKGKKNLFSSPFVLGIARNKVGEGFYFKALNYLIYNYDEIIRIIIYIITCLFIFFLILFINNYKKTISKSLALRILILMGVLSLNLLLEKNIVSLLFFHSIII